MTDFIAGLERDLMEAAARRAAAASPRARPPIRSLLLAAALLLAVAGSAAAGTLLALRGSVIPAPAERDAGPQQTPAPGTVRVEPLRAADPAGGPPWALRVARSRTGLLCGTVGQARGGQFGLVGLDGRFRVLAEGVVDGCGHAPMIGTRVFAARRPADVRTVVNGVAGPSLRSVTVAAAGRRRSLEVGPDGSFLLALRGYPEDIGIDVRLVFAGGRREVHHFGRSAAVVRDPGGDNAWKLESVGGSGVASDCVLFETARQGSRSFATSPAACGSLGDVRRQRGYFFAVRRIDASGPRGHGDFPGYWRGHPARTAVWGEVGKNVKRVDVIGPDGPRRVPLAYARDFLALFTPDVAPSSLRVRITLRDGTVRTHRGDTHLARQP
jgi:hypothetical protein